VRCVKLSALLSLPGGSSVNLKRSLEKSKNTYKHKFTELRLQVASIHVIVYGPGILVNYEATNVVL
jgi:hypothetical protein